MKSIGATGKRNTGELQAGLEKIADGKREWEMGFKITKQRRVSGPHFVLEKKGLGRYNVVSDDKAIADFIKKYDSDLDQIGQLLQIGQIVCDALDG